jgi:hypothetical protein
VIHVDQHDGLVAGAVDAHRALAQREVGGADPERSVAGARERRWAKPMARLVDRTSGVSS